VRETGRGNRVADLSRDKTDVSRGWGNKWQRVVVVVVVAVAVVVACFFQDITHPTTTANSAQNSARAESQNSHLGDLKKIRLN